MPDVVEKDGLTFERPEKWAWIRGG
jgi:hypothetical protein